MSKKQFYRHKINEDKKAGVHFKKFLKIVNGDIPHDIRETIAYNVAGILKLDYPNEKISDLAQKAMKRFFSQAESKTE